jgi:hypothetical protein
MPGNSAAAFGDRYRSNAISYDGSLLLLGGISGNLNQNDIWSSQDGATWKKGFRTSFDFSQR